MLFSLSSFRTGTISLLLFLAGVTSVPDLVAAPGVGRETVTVEAEKDTHLAAHPSEQTINYGKSGRTKIKHRENFPLMTFDLSELPAEATVKRAILYLHATKDECMLNHVSVSTVPTDWVEGTRQRVEKDHDAACLRWPGPSDANWGWVDDRDVFGSIFGNGGNVTGLDVAEREQNNWWSIELPPRVVDAMKTDQPGGLILQDEMIKRSGPGENIYFHTRDQSGGKWAPYLNITYAIEDETNPSPPDVTSVAPGPYPGSVTMTIRAGGDDGNRGRALGFDMKANNKPLDRYMIPRPNDPGETTTAILEELDPDASYRFSVTAYDEAGNRSRTIRSGPVRPAPETPQPLYEYREVPVEKGDPIQAGSFEIYAVDGLEKINPVNGAVYGNPTKSPETGSLVYNGDRQRLELFGARGEILGTHLVVSSPQPPTEPVKIRVDPGPLSDGSNTIEPEAYRLYNVFYARNDDGNDYPDAAPPDSGPFHLPAKKQNIEGQTNRMIPMDLYIPQDAPPGRYSGEIELSIDGADVTLPVKLRVYDVRIPDAISYYVELNDYGAYDRDTFFARHRLAHYHRQGYNVVPYSHSGNKSLKVFPDIAGTGRNARVTDWSNWNDWMTPLLDGSLFDDLPRAGQPIPHFYLPFYENWPMPLEEHYTDRSLADRPPKENEQALQEWATRFARNAPLMKHALDEAWNTGNRRIADQFRSYFEERGWTDTEFQVFLNNKYYKGDLSYWTLDEPSCGHDFRALAHINKTFVRPFVNSNLNVVARSDVSRPQYQGNTMNHVPNNLLNISAGYATHAPLVRRMIVRHGFRTWRYGGGPPVTDPGVTIVALIVKNWTLGTDGSMPYWTVFRGSTNWTDAPPLRLVYPGDQHGYEHTSIGSLRLFAQRRGQQFGELFNLLTETGDWTRWRLARTIRHHLDLGGNLSSAGSDDPGQVQFQNITPADLAALRRAVLHELSR